MICSEAVTALVPLALPRNISALVSVADAVDVPAVDAARLCVSFTVEVASPCPLVDAKRFLVTFGDAVVVEVPVAVPKR